MWVKATSHCYGELLRCWLDFMTDEKRSAEYSLESTQQLWYADMAENMERGLFFFSSSLIFSGGVGLGFCRSLVEREPSFLEGQVVTLRGRTTHVFPKFPHMRRKKQQGSKRLWFVIVYIHLRVNKQPQLAGKEVFIKSNYNIKTLAFTVT